MVVNEFNLLDTAFGPRKAEAPPTIHPYTVASLAVSAEFLESIAGRDAQIAQTPRCFSGVEHLELSHQRLPKLWWYASGCGS